MTVKAFIVHAVAASAVSLLSPQSLAADPPKDPRATSGTVMPSSGTTVPVPDAARAASGNSPKPAKTVSSLSRRPPADCAAMRKRFADSQACFAPYRLANGAIRAEAYKRCRETPDPSATCGPESVSPGQ
ncbi:MAG TPA: hypothetical protein VGH48_17465 [Caldimonas sp.]